MGRFICIIAVLALSVAGCRTFFVPDRLPVRFETEPGSLASFWKGVHVQGFACAPDAVYLGVDRSGIFKFDWNGHLLKHVDAPNHTGDICWHDGCLYTSVDVLDGPRPKRSGIVQVYDAELNLLQEAFLEQGIDGICAKDGVLYLGMNNVPAQHRVNQIGRMNAKTLEFIDRVDIDYGHDTSWGTQNITTDGENFWVEFYSQMPLAVFDRDWKPIRTLDFKSNQGFDFLPARFQGKHRVFACGKNFRRGNEPAYRIDFFEFNGAQMVPMFGREKQ